MERRLVVLRGPSGSGKSTTARELRRRIGRGTAWIEQDYFRRIVLWEHDIPGGINIELISLNVRLALERGLNVVLEGILNSGRYGAMLKSLYRDYWDESNWYYFDVSFAETARRHAMRQQAVEFSVDDMRRWYQSRDLLGFVDENLIKESSALGDTVDQIYEVLMRSRNANGTDGHKPG